MPVKRRKVKGRKFQLGDEAVELFERARALQLRPGYEEWEDAGGCRREYLDAWKALHMALQLPLYAASPLDVEEDTPLHSRGECYLASIPHAIELRRQLKAAQTANHST